MEMPLNWLLEGEPWIQYRTRRDLLDEPENAPEVQPARAGMVADTRLKTMVDDLAAWPGAAITNHKNAGHLIHKLTFLADLGFSAEDPGMSVVVKRIREHVSPQGPFQVIMNIPTHFGGSGKDERAWALCDTPLVVYALAKLGLSAEADVQRAAGYLAGLSRENGWPCAVSPELGRFRGPGRKEDPCPYANLVLLKALGEVEDFRSSGACRAAAETLLTAWRESETRHPYLFYMGVDFRKLKAPLVWYDLLHVLDVLTRFGWLRQDARLMEMVFVLKSAGDAQGRFTPASVWTAWKDWEFGQKKEPSRWVTLMAWRILRRMGIG